MNSKGQLTFEEFIKIGIEEKRERYIELSDKDKFRVRTSDYIYPITVGKIDMDKYWTKYPERKKEMEKARNEINEYLDNCIRYKELKEN